MIYNAVMRMRIQWQHIMIISSLMSLCVSDPAFAVAKASHLVWLFSTDLDKSSWTYFPEPKQMCYLI